MKKLISALLIAVLLLSASAFAFADEVQSGTTTITTTVPAATYELSIPADKKIDYNTTSVSLGNVTISNASGFADGKNIEVTPSWTSFTSTTTNTTIPVKAYAYGSYTYYTTNLQGSSVPNDATGNYLMTSGSSKLVFSGATLSSDGADTEAEFTSGTTVLHVSSLSLSMTSTDWGKALAGDYTATITFSAEVVSGS